jgi:transketolase
MRGAFNAELLRLAQQDERIYLVLADIGYGEIEPFAAAFPDRYFNCGVAEQNMTGIACGIALEGKIAVTYSIANFPTLRPLEQIRNDICYHHANVKIVIIGGGLAYGPLGVSHQATEDLAIMRALPDMVVCCPADLQEARAAVRAMIAYDGPFYYRCGYKGEPDLHQGPINFELGQALQVQDGRDVTLIGTGTITYRVWQAAQILEREGVHCRVLSMHTVKPLDREAILAAARETGGIMTVEEHNLLGGLGGAVAEVIAQAGVGIPFAIKGLPDAYVHKFGSHDWLLDQYGFAPEALAQSVRTLLQTPRCEVQA